MEGDVKIGPYGYLAFAVTLVTFSGLAMADGSPFCVVTSYSKNCYYTDANECREQAYKDGGMCVLNEDAGKPAPNPNQGFIDEMQREQQVSKEKEQAEALEKQTQLLQQIQEQGQSQPCPQPQSAPTVVYVCRKAGKPVIYTTTAYAGCEVFLVR